ncbi:MAG: AbrB/MazE/SpoVT family DNA-binding domain-containing protein [Candidatus Aenigmarchaeota archaeon]|nr:AbrB/MazE/SpoVT family DNA-binding domain-containing protein [Candidatus Aenigmarchaeota archaeon]
MKAITRMRKIGGSLMITIPKEIVKEEALKEGQIVEVEIKRTIKSGFGIAKGIGPYKHEKFSDFD